MKKSNTIAKNLIFGLALSAVLSLSAAVYADEAAEAEGTVDFAAEYPADQLFPEGKFVVGIEGTYPPFTYHEADGELAGFDVEIARLIGEKLGVEIEFVEAAWDSLLIGVDTGRFDTVINCVSITDERKEKYNFSDPYFFSQKLVIVRGDNDEINSPDDLNGTKIATNLTNADIPWYEAHGAEIVGIDTSAEAFDLVLSGRVDFDSSTPVILNDYLEEHPDANLKVAFVIPDFESRVGIPLRKDETDRLDAINAVLESLREDGTLATLSEKYFNDDYTVSAFDDEAPEEETEG